MKVLFLAVCPLYYPIKFQRTSCGRISKDRQKNSIVQNISLASSFCVCANIKLMYFIDYIF